MRRVRTISSHHSWHRQIIWTIIRLCVSSFILQIADAHSAQWCSLCNDFREYLILCAGCRVGICCTSPDVTTGCLEWAVFIDDNDFIFYCPFCVHSVKQKCLVSDASPFQPASSPDCDFNSFAYEKNCRMCLMFGVATILQC